MIPPPAASSGTNGLSKSRFLFPADGVPNDNRLIGPFGYSGRTATVTGKDGAPLGYAYFFGLKGQAYNVERDGECIAYAPGLQLPISGADATGKQVIGSVDFDAAELKPGASKRQRVGGLEYTVKVLAAKVTSLDGKPVFDLSSVMLLLDVRRAH